MRLSTEMLRLGHQRLFLGGVALLCVIGIVTEAASVDVEPVKKEQFDFEVSVLHKNFFILL